MPHSKVFDPITWHLRYHNFCNIETTLHSSVGVEKADPPISQNSERPIRTFTEPILEENKTEKRGFHSLTACFMKMNKNVSEIIANKFKIIIKKVLHFFD